MATQELTSPYRVTRVGETSLTMAFELVADGAVAARGEVVHVALAEADETTAIPDRWCERIREFEDEPVESL